MPRITVFDASDSPWTGEAFQDDSGPGLTNSPAAWMSASAADPLHYVRWLQENYGSTDEAGEPITVETVMPRPVYGRYLREVMAATAERAAGEGGALRRVRDVVRAVGGERGALRLTGAEEYGPFHRVLVCVGPGERPDPYGLTGRPGYLHRPYPLGDLVRQPTAGAPVLVIGSGLTAVDAALALLDREPGRPVTMVSRHGLLPMPRVPLGEPPSLAHLTRPRIDEAVERCRAGGSLLAALSDLVDAELREYGTSLSGVLPVLVPTDDAATRLRKALTDPRGHPWQGALVHAAADHFAYAFHQLTEAEKDTVVTRMHPYLRNFGVPMPQDSARRLLAALDGGALRVLPGLTSVRADDGGFTAHTAAGRVRAEFAVNAVNEAAESWRGPAGTVLESLVAGGYAQRSPHGGLRTDLDSLLRDADGRTHPDLAALGTVTRGSHYLIDAVVLTSRHLTRLLDRWYPM